MSPLEKHTVVVAGIDLSPSSARVLDAAFEAAERAQGAELHVIAVASGRGDELRLEAHEGTLSAEAAARKVRDYVQEELGRLQKNGPGHLEHVVTHLGVGDPVVEITTLAAELDADLVVVGTHGHGGVKRLVVGSTAEKVARTAHAPVLIARSKDWRAHSKVPELSAACPECVRVRRESEGAELWCEQHRTLHGRRHTYHFSRVASPHNSGFLIPRFHA
jgi:nucleotide-binding universal stress UspA family protein